ncbi:MAG TPA: nuclear transport factor 2 family protein [Cellvibrionaceae bacterium]|nr:nuclear transport factor 2 family protein [Cellvibrionaceae bacterium]HMW70930.1 nuclear transport factor 2 family protein [Cellvibrionaceae bacterium]
MWAAVLFGLLGCASNPQVASHNAREAVIATELAFAKTMADRDFAAFTSYIAQEAVFLQHIPLQGKNKIVEHWKPLYQAPKAPFSWRPEEVEVLESGKLAISTGPVFDPNGKITHRFTSIWRLRPDGKWEIIFDQGNPFCEDKK